MELPPRARRIRLPTMQCGEKVGTTSACAENTFGALYTPAPHWNYLRVRGEYRLITYVEKWMRELPPRARRIHVQVSHRHQVPGTTSACAENTFRVFGDTTNQGNYLRVRGEYAGDQGERGTKGELPPRARRILGGAEIDACVMGTTSACAENTLNELGLL